MIVIKLAQYNEIVSQISRQFVILDLKNCFRKFDLVYINKNHRRIRTHCSAIHKPDTLTTEL